MPSGLKHPLRSHPPDNVIDFRLHVPERPPEKLPEKPPAKRFKLVRAFFKRLKPSITNNTAAPASSKPGIDLANAHNSSTPLDTLPSELQSEILCLLSGYDILRLQQVNRGCFRLVKLHESTLSRHLWKRQILSQSSPCLCQNEPEELVGRYTCAVRGRNHEDFGTAIPQTPTWSSYIRLLRSESAIETMSETVVRILEASVMGMTFQQDKDSHPNTRDFFKQRMAFGFAHMQDYLFRYQQLLVNDLRSEHNRARGSELSRHQELMATLSIPCLLEMSCAAQFLLLAMFMKFRVKVRARSFWTVTGRPGYINIDLIQVLLVHSGLEPVQHLLSLKPFSARKAALKQYYKSMSQQNFGSSSAWMGSGLPRTSARDRDNIRKFVLREKGLTQWAIMARRLQQARSNPLRPLPNLIDYLAYATKMRLDDMDFGEIQEDWTSHYMVD